MRRSLACMRAVLIGIVLSATPAGAGTRTENFDEKPVNWEGVNNRCTHFAPQTVSQDFGYSPTTSHAGGKPGEVGGRIQSAGEPAFYGYGLPKPLTFDDPINASGKMYLARGQRGHFYLGLFHVGTLSGWRTPNTLAARIDGRTGRDGPGFHCFIDYGTSKWRAGSDLMGEIDPDGPNYTVAGHRVNPRLMPDDAVYEWKLSYDPAGADGNGLLTFSLGDQSVVCPVDPEHRVEGATFTHFGLFPVLKSAGDPAVVWIDDVTINGTHFDFSEYPLWDGMNNRRTYETWHVRPNFNFGWSPTRIAGGKQAGEFGGLIFCGDCRYPERMASYGDRLSTLTLDNPLIARGKICVTRYATDSEASFGFYNAKWSMHSDPSKKRIMPMDYIGIGIGGSTPTGYYFSPFCSLHGDPPEGSRSTSTKAPRIYPDGKVHDWSFTYDPEGADGNGRITVTLDDKTCSLDLGPGYKDVGATFDRFGICTTWRDGNSQTVYFDDITYTCSPSAAVERQSRPADRTAGAPPLIGPAKE